MVPVCPLYVQLHHSRYVALASSESQGLSIHANLNFKLRKMSKDLANGCRIVIDEPVAKVLSIIRKSIYFVTTYDFSIASQFTVLYYASI